MANGKPTTQAGEATTVNYGWVKPTVGASVDAWGGYINTDLDGIDSTVKSISNSVPAASSTTPAMDGTAAVGTGTTYARADHVHPVDTSRYAATNPNGYQTAAQVTASLGPYALIASPVFTGVPAAPTPSPGTNTTQLATTAFVTAATAGSVNVNPNRIDNGDMWVDQHNSGASIAMSTGGSYCPDRWASINSLAKFTIGQNYSVATKAPGFQYFAGVQTTGTGAAPAAADVSYFYQTIEYDTFGDFGWGTANAQPATLSFWVNSSLTGNFSISLQGHATPYRAFITTYNIPTANTWTKIVVPIPADTTVSSTNWTGAGNASGLSVLFDLGSGANVQTSTGLGAWQNTTTATVASGAVKLVATSNAKFAVTGVKLELGSVATPWLHEDLARSLARCQRYYQSFTGLQVASYSPGAGGVTTATITYPPMRATPTATPTGQSYNNASALFVSPAAPTNAQTGVTAAAGGGVFCGFNLALSAEI